MCPAYIHALGAGPAIGEQHGHTRSGAVVVTFTGKAHHVGVVEVVVLGAVRQEVADIHQNRQLSDCSQVPSFGSAKQIAPEHARHPLFTQQNQRVSGGFKPSLHRRL